MCYLSRGFTVTLGNKPDIFGKAIFAYYQGDHCPNIRTYLNGQLDRKTPVKLFFRECAPMPRIRRVALKLCYGKTLDVGADAGAHTIFLQAKQIDITALEASPLAARAIQQRGAQRVICKNIIASKANALIPSDFVNGHKT